MVNHVLVLMHFQTVCLRITLSIDFTKDILRSSRYVSISFFHTLTEKLCTFRETLSINNGDLELTGFDLGGHKQVRRIWKDYYEAVDAVVFMLDASDISRLAEAKSELQLVINDEDLRRRRIPILILANKIDAQVCDNYCDDHRDYGDDRIIMNFDRVIDTLDYYYRKVIGFFQV